MTVVAILCAKSTAVAEPQKSERTGFGRGDAIFAARSVDIDRLVGIVGLIAVASYTESQKRIST